MSETLQAAAPPAAKSVDVVVAKPGRKSDKLTEALKTYAVELLGVGETATAIAQRLRREYGTRISRNAIECYDPEPSCRSRLSA